MVTQMVKNLPALQETQGRGDPLEKGWQPTLVFLPGKSHGQRNLGATVHAVAESDAT